MGHTVSLPLASLTATQATYRIMSALQLSGRVPGLLATLVLARSHSSSCLYYGRVFTLSHWQHKLQFASASAYPVQMTLPAQITSAHNSRPYAYLMRTRSILTHSSESPAKIGLFPANVNWCQSSKSVVQLCQQPIITGWPTEADLAVLL